MIQWKQTYIIVFFVSFLLFTGLFFGGKIVYDFFSYNEELYIEDTFIEPEPQFDAAKEVVINQNAGKQQEYQAEVIQKNIPEIAFHYLPYSYKQQDLSKIYTILLSTFYFSDPIYNQLSELHTYFYEQRTGSRGKMKNKKIHLFSPTSLPREEFLAVSIHEFGHFLDLYILKKELYYDVSDRFYAISWVGSKKMQAGSRSTDFVSGYAMTNKYEDFAESFTYYILHNSDFLEKAGKSEVLMKKYNFFVDYVFINGEYQTDVYKTTKTVKKYYRDTTKIEYSLTDFLQYLEGGNIAENFRKSIEHNKH